MSSPDTTPEPTMEQKLAVALSLLRLSFDRETAVEYSAEQVRKYWRDWPQQRRDAVRALSSFLADAIEALCDASDEIERARRERQGIDVR